MTPEERKAYNKKYRAEGYGANGDARYRAKHRKALTDYMREYRRKKRRDAQ